MRCSPKIAAVLCLLLLGLPGAIARADRYSSDAPFGQSNDPVEKSTEKVVSFNEFRDGFRKLCVYVAQDGRQEALYKVLEGHQGKDPNCGACRPLFTLFSTVCKPDKVVKQRPAASQRVPKVEDGASPVPTPTLPIAYPQREPNIRVIETVSSVFPRIAERNFGQEATAKALRKFLAVLRKAEGCTPGERDYLLSLAQFMESPVRELLEEYPDDRAAVELRSLSAE